MRDMMTALGVIRTENIDRVQELRGAISHAIEAKPLESKMLSSQVSHLSSSLHKLRSQVDDSADFSVDVIGQLRIEIENVVNSKLGKMLSEGRAANAGGADAWLRYRRTAATESCRRKAR